MGPWLRSHGRAAGAALAGVDFRLQWGRGFAATEGSSDRTFKDLYALLQWGRGFAATEGSPPLLVDGTHPLGFNGAVASQPRKGNLPQAGREADHPLQWGRGFAATEGS